MNNGIVSMETAFGITIPEATETYQPVPNKELWGMLNESAGNRGLELGVPQMSLTQQGQRLFGSVEVTNQDHLDEQVRLMLGFRNSYNRTLSVGICFGSKVFVCSNMCFTGYTSEDEEAVGQIHHRHSVNVWDGLRSRLNSALDKFEVFKKYQDSFYSRLKEFQLSDAQAHDFIIQSVRSGAITPKDCFTVAEEWAFQERGPRDVSETDRWHREFLPRTAWSLFNAFTEVHKSFQEKNPFDANLRSIKTSGFFHKSFITN